ncbi:MAG: bifunctional riboflavin kinase/FAD synthetase [Anaerolineae bacterium]|jgi:riboflavin kinase/FMN adenylyltransferase|nr:bifunctional riboflavin kinase/FAD synthetase [Anaerolineae bacterium]
MKHLYQLTDAALDRPSVVTIGVFDGVHRGHQALIEKLVQEARRAQRLAVVLTFFPHPDRVIRGLTGRYYLSSPDQRAQQLGELGVDLVITHPFNEQVRQMRASMFVDQMIEHLKLGELWVGMDFAMGYRREGNVTFLLREGLEKGFIVTAIDLIADEQQTKISSTAIRDALLAGNITQANEWLGRRYEVSGEVVHGQARGRTIGFPTANLQVWEEQVIPANGVYAGWAILPNGDRYMAVTNIGTRPTFQGVEVTVEAHLLHFDGDLYGQILRFQFEERLRGEQRFNGIEALITQIRADAAMGEQLLSKTITRS